MPEVKYTIEKFLDVTVATADLEDAKAIAKEMSALVLCGRKATLIQKDAITQYVKGKVAS